MAPGKPSIADVVSALLPDHEGFAACPVMRKLRSSSRWPLPSNGATMSDKSPKSKQRSQKQKKIAKAAVAAAAKSKQDSQGQVQKATPQQGKK
jgi:hypothetical protein